MLVALTAVLLGPITALTLQRGPGLNGVVVSPPPPPSALEPLPVGPGTISGRAIDQDTKVPIASATAVIRLLGGRPAVAVTPNARALQGGRVVTTDADGRFTADQIPLGDYAVTVSAAGWASVGTALATTSGKTMRLSAEQPTATADFVFSRLGSIGGTVRDDQGRPVADVVVRLLERTPPTAPALAPPLMVRPIPFNALTDGTGVYRFTSVAPGSYFVCVYFRSTTMPASVLEMYRLAIQAHDENRVLASLQDSESPVPRPLPPGLSFKAGPLELSIDDAQQRLQAVSIGTDGRILVPQTTYHPSGLSLEDAGLITLAAGGIRTDVDIRMRAQPTVRVSGRLTGAEGETRYIGLRLLTTGSDQLYRTLPVEAGLTVSDVDGRFTFLGIPAGSYALEGFSSPYPPGETRPGSNIPVGPDGILLRRALRSWVRSDLTVGQTDVTDLSLAVRKPLSVRGRLEFVDASGSPTPARPATGGIRLSLAPATGQRISFATTSDVTDGAFSLGPAFPAKYTLRAAVMGPWRVASIMSGGKNIADQTIELTDRDLTDVVITLATIR
jgi:hypothetical protein